MQTKAVRMYGKQDLRLETFELPTITEEEILAEVVSDSICLSTWKAAKQGSEHKRVPDDIDVNPVIVGHEFCGKILEVGSKWKDQYHPGDKFAIQPALNYKGSLYAPGYSYQYIGGASQYIVIPGHVMELGCLLPYDGEAYFLGSLSEPMSCIVGTFHAMYHTSNGSYEHEMGIKEGGSLALLAAAGPMGLGAIDYAINAQIRPSLLVVTDIDQGRLDRAAAIYPPEFAAKRGVKLVYFNTASTGNPIEYLRSFTPTGGYDDVMAFAPVRAVVEQADAILGRDGCLNFFAGPTDNQFSAMVNFYNVHYSSTHFVGTSGGNTADMLESLDMMAKGAIRPMGMLTHIGGLNSTIESTLNLPKIPGGKKLIYNHIDMPLTAIEDFGKLGETDPLYAALAKIVAEHDGMWCTEAEQYLLTHGKKI